MTKTRRVRGGRSVPKVATGTVAPTALHRAPLEPAHAECVALAHIPADLNALATAVAWLLLSEYALARKVAHGNSAVSAPITASQRETIIASRLGKASDGTRK